MAYLNDENTDINIPMELDLFDEPKNQVAIDRIFYSETRPLSNFTSSDASTVEFFISGQGPEYMDLRRSRLYVRAKIVKGDGSAFDDTDTTSIVNLPLQAMWSQIDVYMNNKLVSVSTSNYPWKAYLKTILNSGSDEQKSQLQSQLFMKDIGNLASTDGKSGANTGEDGAAYKLELLDCVYKACKIKVDPGILVNHMKQIEIKPVRYYFQRTEVKRNTINKSSSEFIWDNLFTIRPSTLVVGLISQDSGNGSYGTNPFFFNHYNATDVGIYVNGESVPSRPLKLDFGDNRQYAVAYTNLFEACEKLNKDAGLTISREDFGKGYTLHAFQLDPSGLGDDYINLVKHGNVRLEMKFSTALPTAVTWFVSGNRQIT
ncbi:uncharacterized protein F54H12.2-like [Mytilus trossulus]|uniref:uncharacterized protein F54H12.2-like n=1 Tax=Mytilus trossulus TaxID=6551 RepID=UPI00300478DB